MKPLNQFLIVLPISEVKKGSVFIPLSNSLPYKKGIVKYVSDKVSQVKVGEQIAYQKRIVAEYEELGESMDIINEEALIYIE